MFDSKYDRLPKAGDSETKSGVDFIYLSPKPLPTGAPPFSSRDLHRESNDVYLDFAVGRGNFEFMARAGIGSVVFIALFFLFTSGFGAWLRRDIQPFLTTWVEIFTNTYVQGFIWTLFIVYIFIFFLAVRRVSIHPPIRFNRHRREVAFVPQKGDSPCYVAWESVITCVSSGQLITQYAVLPEHKLMIGLRDTNTGNVLWSTISTGSFNLAVSEWEAIRTYMEEGPSMLPAQNTDAPEEGSVAFFHLCRRSYRAENSLLRYISGFLVIQFLSGWTVPCHISRWVNTRPKAGFPRDVLEWSKPLQLNQQIKPSEDLLHETAEIRKFFSKGKTLLDYFRSKSLIPEKQSSTRGTEEERRTD